MSQNYQHLTYNPDHKRNSAEIIADACLPPILTSQGTRMDEDYCERIIFHTCGYGGPYDNYDHSVPLWDRVLNLRDWIWENLEDKFVRKDDANLDGDEFDDGRATLQLCGVTLCLRRPRQYQGRLQSASPSPSVESILRSSTPTTSQQQSEYERYGVRPPNYTERTSLLVQQPTLRSIHSQQPPRMAPMLIPTPGAFMYAHPSYHSTSSTPRRPSPSRSNSSSSSPPRSPPRPALCSPKNRCSGPVQAVYKFWVSLTGGKVSATCKTVRFSGENDIVEYTKADWEPTGCYKPDYSQIRYEEETIEVKIQIGSKPPMIVRPTFVKPVIVHYHRRPVNKAAHDKRRNSNSSTQSHRNSISPLPTPRQITASA